MDRKDTDFARSWVRHYVRTKHPHGLDEVESLRDVILSEAENQFHRFTFYVFHFKLSERSDNGRAVRNKSQDHRR